MKKLVLVGGGHSHAIAIHSFINQPLVNTQIILITDVLQAPYSGMLPGYIAGFYDYPECHIDLDKLARVAGVEIVVAGVSHLDLDRQQITCSNGQVFSYDLLSINTGSTPDLSQILGANNYGTPVKPVPQFLTAWQDILEYWKEDQSEEKSLTITLVGGGAGGVELALNMQQKLANIYKLKSKPENHKLKINLIHRNPDLLPNYNQRIGKYLLKLLHDRGIEIHLGESVQKIVSKNISKNKDSNSLPSYNLHCESGLEVLSDRVFWVTNASAPVWVKNSGLATDRSGFIAVNNYLQSISHPQVFAVGDIAAMVNYQLPKAGVFAVRQGLPLAHNLQRLTQGKPLQPYKPQSRYLGLIGTGDQKALAVYGNWGLYGDIVGSWLWRWKDGIDQKFMRQFP
jgi:pyridine nucleotide-disulfide oxidoreductase family protein